MILLDRRFLAHTVSDIGRHPLPHTCRQPWNQPWVFVIHTANQLCLNWQVINVVISETELPNRQLIWLAALASSMRGVISGSWRACCADVMHSLANYVLLHDSSSAVNKPPNTTKPQSVTLLCCKRCACHWYIVVMTHRVHHVDAQLPPICFKLISARRPMLILHPVPSHVRLLAGQSLLSWPLLLRCSDKSSATLRPFKQQRVANTVCCASKVSAKYC